MARLKSERGAVAVLTALTIVILFAAVAFVVDISRLYHERQVLQNAVDFGSLAAAQDLPVQGLVEKAKTDLVAQTIAKANAPQVTNASLKITYQCVVADRNNDGVPDPGEVPFVCGPPGTTTTWTSEWTVKGNRVIHPCRPENGDKCNTIRLSTESTIPYYFAPVIGINTGSTGAVNAASCNGSCGAASSPIDVVLVLDRTGSMSTTDVANVKNAALSVLDFYDPADQWIGMVALPYGMGTAGSTNPVTGKCEVYGDRRTASQGNPTPPPTYQIYPTAAGSNLWWNTTGLINNYKTGTVINPSSNLVMAINCLQRARNYTGTEGDRVYARSDGQPTTGQNAHTNLGDPLDAARAMLAGLTGRADVPDVIIFMTDGQANQPSTRQPCQYFNDKANLAKSAGQTIFTIAYGLDNSRCLGDTSGSPFYNTFATTNMTSAATQPTFDEWAGTCNPLENKDGDHYFCAPATADLEPVFRQVAAAAIDGAHLIE